MDLSLKHNTGRVKVLLFVYDILEEQLMYIRGSRIRHGSRELGQFEALVRVVERHIFLQAGFL